MAGFHIYGIVQTIFNLQNPSVSSYINKKVLTNIFTEERLQRHPVKQP